MKYREKRAVEATKWDGTEECAVYILSEYDLNGQLDTIGNETVFWIVDGKQMDEVKKGDYVMESGEVWEKEKFMERYEEDW